MRQIKLRVWDGAEMSYSPEMGTIEFCKWVDFFSLNSILMQFTGLLDRHGKEIYEGDIVQPGVFAEVKFENGSFVLEKEGLPKGATVYDIKNMINIEVVGNRFENPELINPKE